MCIRDRDGVVEQPRIISGCALDDYMKLAALSELNLHYINSHFTHPDDSLDPERGAELGWETLKTLFIEYLDWLYTCLLYTSGNFFGWAVRCTTMCSPLPWITTGPQRERHLSLQ